MRMKRQPKKWVKIWKYTCNKLCICWIHEKISQWILLWKTWIKFLKIRNKNDTIYEKMRVPSQQGNSGKVWHTDWLFHPILLRMVSIRRQSTNVDEDVEKRNYCILRVQTVQKLVQRNLPYDSGRLFLDM